MSRSADLPISVDPPSDVPGQFGHARWFWIGVVMMMTGVLVHLIDFLLMRGTKVVSGMDSYGFFGLLLDLGGMVLGTYGLLPRDWQTLWRGRHQPEPALDTLDAAPVADNSNLQAMDSVRLTGAHWRMLSRLFVGIALDTMKPALIGFTLPGMRAEYHLTPSEASIFPFAALLGTTLGSVMFGVLGDIIGRRASFILTAMMLAGVSICGFMPGFAWQVAVCFIMGLAAGGELPVIYTLLAETMPAKHRGWISVAASGTGALAGFFAASTVTYLLEPVFTWRILFFSNFPTALLMLLLVKWVPESPRYLIQTGHLDEARRVMTLIGVRVTEKLEHGLALGVEQGRGLGDLLGSRLRGVTATLCLYGFAWGLCNWGFITWLPTMLRSLGLQPGVVSSLLATSSLFAIPGTLGAAALFGFWSSKWSAVVFALATAASLLFFAVTQPFLLQRPDLVAVGVIALLIASNSMIGVLAPYSVELFPTALRSAGSGVVAGSSKAGGLVGPIGIGAVLTLTPGLALPAILISVPIAAAGLLMSTRSRETRGRRLEDLTAEVLAGH